MSIPDPTDSDSPLIGSIQPTWRRLPYFCEIVYFIYTNPQKPISELRHELIRQNKRREVNDSFNFLEDVGLLEKEVGLLPQGEWLAQKYSRPKQTKLNDSISIGVTDDSSPPSGEKKNLSESESRVWTYILFSNDWVPMLGTINQLATSSVSAKETDSRAKEFYNRLKHLSKYKNYDSTGTKQAKAKVHFKWVQKIGLAEVNRSDKITLTEKGDFLHQQLRPHYHPDWPSSPDQ